MKRKAILVLDNCFDCPNCDRTAGGCDHRLAPLSAPHGGDHIPAWCPLVKPFTWDNPPCPECEFSDHDGDCALSDPEKDQCFNEAFNGFEPALY